MSQRVMDRERGRIFGGIAVVICLEVEVGVKTRYPLRVPTKVPKEEEEGEKGINLNFPFRVKFLFKAQCLPLY